MDKLAIIYKNISDIKPYKHNAKLHPPEHIAQIAKSIQDFGFNDPVAVDEDGVIIEGHGRLEAAKKLGMDTIPVIVLAGLTDQQKKAYILAHNQLTMNTGFDLDILSDELERITEFDMGDFGFDDLGNRKAERTEDPNDDDFDGEPVQNPTSKPGDIYKLGGHRLMCGDSTSVDDVAKLMNGEKADLVVTDPPYNVDYTGKTKDALKIKNDNMSRAAFEEFIGAAMRSVEDSLKPGGCFYVWYGFPGDSVFITAIDNTPGLSIRQQIIWRKDRSLLSRSDYNWRHEPCLYGWKDGAAHYFVGDFTQTTVLDEAVDVDALPVEKVKKLLKRLIAESNELSTVMDEKKPLVSDLHPTMKPVPLFGKLIHNSSRVGENILDLFGGSGTTIIACEQMDRRAFVMEYDPRYVDTIIKRWEDFTGKKAELIERRDKQNV